MDQQTLNGSANAVDVERLKPSIRRALVKKDLSDGLFEKKAAGDLSM